MTASGQTETNGNADISEGEVVAFLRANSSFLDHHPELLSELSVSHPSGDAASLLERQVALLRDENARLKRQFDELVSLARQNEHLNGKIHALALTLMNAAGPQSIFDCLDGCLRADFGADHVAVNVYAEPAFVDSADVPQFVGAEAPGRAAFSDALSAGETRCGPLDASQAGALFGDGASGASAVIMPLTGKTWDGVLVIASDDATRYESGMGTEFLTYLKDVVALVVDPWVKRPRAT